jgi:hypothetical protein
MSHTENPRGEEDDVLAVIDSIEAELEVGWSTPPEALAEVLASERPMVTLSTPPAQKSPSIVVSAVAESAPFPRAPLRVYPERPPGNGAESVRVRGTTSAILASFKWSADA